MMGSADDDQSIADIQIIWRRIPPEQAIERDGTVRPSSGAFCDSSDGSGMSCSLAVDDRSPVDLLQGQRSGSGVVALTAKEVRAEGLTLVRRPEPGDPHHIEVCGKKTDGTRKRLSRQAKWVIEAMPTIP